MPRRLSGIPSYDEPRKPKPVAEGQTSAFDDSEAPPAETSRGRWYCQSCGSPNLVGVSPALDVKGRFATAVQCNGCGKANVIAGR